MTQKDLKNRFDKLTVKKMESGESGTTLANGSSLELPVTNHPAVFAKLENSDSTPFNWKKLLKKDMIRPSLEMVSNLEVMDIQSLIGSLITTPVLVTVFSPSAENQSGFKDFSNYLKQSPQFWSSILKDSCHVHVRFKGNKTQIWMRKNTLSTISLQDFRLNLDQEFRQNRYLKTYNSTRQDEWIELTVEIAATSLNSQQKEISV